MIVDQQITADLAVVGRTSRSRPRSLATTMHDLGARSRARHVPVSRSVASIYAARVARIVAGSALVGAVIAHFLVLVFHTVSYLDFDADSPLIGYFDQSWGELALLLGVLTVPIYAIAWSIAMHRSKRGLDREHIVRIDRIALAASIAAPLVFIVFFGLLRVILGDMSLLELVRFDDGDPNAVPLWWPGHYAWSVAALACGIGLGVIGAIVVSRASTTPRWVGAVAGGVLAATIYAGLRFDKGPLRYALTTSEVPSTTLRTLLLVIGGASLLAIIATLALLHRRRELAALDRE